MYKILFEIRVIAVRCGPQAAQPQVYLSSYPQRGDTAKSQMLSDDRWENVRASYEEVRLGKIEGRNFLSKMELLMASSDMLGNKHK